METACFQEFTLLVQHRSEAAPAAAAAAALCQHCLDVRVNFQSNNKPVVCRSPPRVPVKVMVPATLVLDSYCSMKTVLLHGS